jgi:hypothetical protein
MVVGSSITDDIKSLLGTNTLAYCIEQKW